MPCPENSCFLQSKKELLERRKDILREYRKIKKTVSDIYSQISSVKTEKWSPGYYLDLITSQRDQVLAKFEDIFREKRNTSQKISNVTTCIAHNTILVSSCDCIHARLIRGKLILINTCIKLIEFIEEDSNDVLKMLNEIDQTLIDCTEEQSSQFLRDVVTRETMDRFEALVQSLIRHVRTVRDIMASG